MMTVGELISRLQGYPQEYDVYLMLTSGGDEFSLIGDIDKDGEAVWVTGLNYASPLSYDETTGRKGDGE